MQNKIEPTPTIDDLVVLTKEEVVTIFRTTDPTMDRILAAARRGENNFPMPICWPGRKLVWSRESIEKYLSENSQTVNPPQLESPTKQRSRNNAALNELEANHGLVVKKVNMKGTAK